MAKIPKLPYYLLITGGETDGFILFLRVFAWWEIPPASSKIWTQVTDSVSYANNRYVKHASLFLIVNFFEMIVFCYKTQVIQNIRKLV